MKLVTWNVNSIRARQERVLAWFARVSPDVACLQEIKCTDKEFPFDAFAALGYEVAIHGQRTYNGVAIAVKQPHRLTEVTRGLDDGVADDQARLIAGTVGGLRVINVYIPNGQAPGTDKYEYKLRWYERLGAYAAAVQREHPRFLVCGDYNVAPAPEDVHDPAVWEGQIHYSEPERAAFATLRDSLGLVDLYRRLHPHDRSYTWWDYRMLAFPKNHGLRIDHILVTPDLAGAAKGCTIDRDERKGKQPSDHAPVIAELVVPGGRSGAR